MGDDEKAGARLTRRTLLALTPLPLTAEQFQTQGEVQQEFYRLQNEFLALFLELEADEVRGTWPVRKAAAVEKAFRAMTTHPGWIRVK